jgi:uncharacterized membrane protein YfcA
LLWSKTHAGVYWTLLISARQVLITGSSLMAGAFIAKRFVLKLDPNVFRLVMDGIMLAAGMAMVWNAFAGAS